MNIRQYYEQVAAVSLNASLAAFIPAIFILFYSVVVTKIYQLLLFIIPFLIYSFYCYQVFLLNKNRAKSIQIESFEKETCATNLLQESTLLLHFLPAPSLRLLFFNPSGIKVGEIRDRSMFFIRWFLPFFLDRFFNRRFILYDQADKPFVHFHLYKDRIEMITQEGVLLTTVYKLQKEKCVEYLLDSQFIQMIKSGIPADYSFVTAENKLFGRIQRGMMPLEWGQKFVNPNTPILTYAGSNEEKDRLQLLAMLINIYMYADH